MANGDLTIAVLREIRDEIRSTRTEALAGQQLIITRYIKSVTKLEDDESEHRARAYPSSDDSRSMNAPPALAW